MISNKTIGSAIVLIALCLAVTPLFAQGPAPTRFSIPFAFVAEGQRLPAGDYTVTFGGIHRLVLQCGQGDCGTAVLITFETDQPPKAVSQRGTIRFVRYGNTYLLQQVRPANQRDWSTLFRSKRETELLKASASRQMASIDAQ